MRAKVTRALDVRGRVSPRRFSRKHCGGPACTVAEGRSFVVEESSPGEGLEIQAKTWKKV